MTEWRCYCAPNFAKLAKHLRGKLIVDARNIWKRSDVERAGLIYQGIGSSGGQARQP
jgi:UDPglucose 6-dehydrogenase